MKWNSGWRRFEFFDKEGVKTLRRQAGKEPGPEMPLSGLAKRPTPEWVSTFGQSRFNRLLFRSARRRFRPLTASQRSVRVASSALDSGGRCILPIQSPLFAVLVGGVFGRIHLSSPASGLTKTPGIEFLMVVAAIWFGCNNAARDIVGEWIVYRRERTVSLKLPSYVFSKVGTGIVRFGNSPYN